MNYWHLVLLETNLKNARCFIIRRHVSKVSDDVRALKMKKNIISFPYIVAVFLPSVSP
jgi:hypothetical protein